MRAKNVIVTSRVALLLVLLACLAFPLTLAQSQQSAPVDTVEPMASTIERPGRLVAFDQVDVYSKVTAFVEEVHADLGDRVKKGQLLAKLTAPEQEQTLEKKKGLLQKAQAGVARAKQAALVLAAAQERSKAEVEEAKELVAQREAVAKRWSAEHTRATKMREQGVLDKAGVDEIANQWNVAKADVSYAQAKVKTAEAALKEAAARREEGDLDIEMAQADLKVAKADAAEWNAWLQYLEIRAPFDGVVTRRNTSKGDFERPPSDARSVPMFSVAQFDRLRVVVDVPEMDALRIRKGTEAAVRIPASQGRVLKLAVARTAEALDRQSRSLSTEIDLPNPDGRLLPGMFANVTFTPQPTKPKQR